MVKAVPLMDAFGVIAVGMLNLGARGGTAPVKRAGLGAIEPQDYGKSQLA
jgi:hypothetical protein